MLKRIVLLLWVLPLFAQAQITVSYSSFSNGSNTGTDGTNTVMSLVGPGVLLSSLAAPTIPASGITFSSVLSTSMTVSLTPGNGVKRLAIMRPGSAPVFVPSNDAIYSGDLGNSEQVVYDGSGTSFNLSGLLPNTVYFIAVYEYNTDGTFTSYLTAGTPLASRQTLSLPLVYVTSPANGAVDRNASLNITARAVSGATVYTIEISDDSAFADSKVRSGGRTLNFDSLHYNTLYYTRVKTNLREDYGQVTTFLTRPAESLAFVTSPADSSNNVNTNLNIIASSVLYASQYRIQLSETFDFANIAFEVSGPTRTLAFAGLKYNTHYYTRVLTSLTENYGAVRTFSTRTAESIAYVTSPADGSVDRNLSLNVSSRDVPGATLYTIQLSESPDFSSVAFAGTGPTRTIAFAGLNYNTTYYSRVLTNLTSAFGAVKSFTTRTAESLAYVTTPTNGAVSVSVNPLVRSNTVPGAATYTIQLSTFADFSSVDFQLTGASRAQNITGLTAGTTYYNRVLTDLTTEFGEVRSFTTAGVPPAGRIRSTGPIVENEAATQPEFSVRAYPNPFKEKLTIYVESSDDEAELTLTDMSGRIVYQVRKRTNQFVEMEEQLSAGAYLLQVRSLHHRKVVRVVKFK